MDTETTKARCRATNRQGEPCGRWPTPGATVCYYHGGAAPAVKAAAARRRAQEAAQGTIQRALADAYGDQVPDIDPGEALLRAVSWKHAEVLAYRQKVAEVAASSPAALGWGVTRVKEGGDDAGTTEEAKPNVWLTLLHEAEDKLVAFSAAALKAGVEERRLRLAEGQGALVADVIRRVLDALDLDERQRELVPTVVPQQLRLIAGGEPA